MPPYSEIVAGPLPTTEKERAAAAAKYGLKPEDYVTYDNGMWGDYPKTPDRPMTDRDYFYDWDYPELQRDYGDIVSTPILFSISCFQIATVHIELIKTCIRFLCH